MALPVSFLPESAPKARMEGTLTKSHPVADIAACDPERGEEATNLENPAGRGESNRDGAAR